MVKRNRRRRVLRGQGAFWDSAKRGYRAAQNWSKTRGKGVMNLSRAVLDTVSPGAGAMAKRITDIMGFGEYKVNRNSLLASGVPAMHSTIDKGIRVTHHEFLTDINSSTAYAINSYAINPGLDTTFPWLSRIAASFQKYEIHGLVFYFKSTSADALNSTNTALGDIIGAVDYNVYAEAPTSKVAAMALAGSRQSKPSEDQIYPLECAEDMTVFTTRLVRNGAYDGDRQKYDAGNFHLVRVGSQASATIGSLFVSYDITLKAPKLTSWVACYHAVLAAAGVANATPLGTTAAGMTVWTDNIGVTIDQTNQKITFANGVSGYFGVMLLYVVTSGANTPPSFLLGSGMGALDLENGHADSIAYAPGVGETSTRVMVRRDFYILNEAGTHTITMSAAVFGGGAVGLAEIWIQGFPPNVY